MRIYYQEAGKPLKKQFKKTLELLTENNDLNYVAYLLADENNISIKVAKYRGEDRIEITSAGSLPERLTKEEFFEGVSVPRNKELMRVYKDLDLVEHLGSGIPRILRFYGKDNFIFSENFTRIVFPINEKAISLLNKGVTEQVTDQVTAKVKRLISLMEGEKSRAQLMESLKITHNVYFRTEYLNKAIELGLVELTIPNKPRSSKQKYRLTEKGIKLKKYLESQE